MAKETHRLIGFADRLSRAIYESGLNCTEIANRVGCDRKSIYSYRDNESNPDVFVVAKLCCVLGVSADYLLFGKKA